MKKRFILITLILLSNLSSSQATKAISKLIYLDSDWQETTEDTHKYYRIVNEYYSERDYYIVNDFFKSGALQMTFKSKDKDIIKAEGQTISYYENGKKKALCNYEANKKIGKEFQWYGNGKIKLEAEHFIAKEKKAPKFRLIQFWDPNNKQTVIDGNGIYSNLEDLEDQEVTNLDSFSEKGEIKNGERNGVWTGKSTKLNVSYTENYIDGKCINGTSTDENSMEYHYTEVMKEAAPANGMQDFYRYIGRQFRIPKIEGLGGKIHITFKVNKNGELINPKVIRDFGYQSGEEAIRVISTAKKWNPSKLRGLAINAFYSLPLTITAN